jgi:integrase
MRWFNSRLNHKFKDIWIDELTTFELRTWINSLAAELAPKSVRNCVGVLSVVLGQAHLDGLVASNPLTPIKLRTLLPRKKKNNEEDGIDPFNNIEISAILSACKTVEERALFQFAFASGLRTGELIALKWAHIDWLAGMVRVQDNIISGEIGTIEKNTKTEADRDVPLLPAALLALQAIKPLSLLRQIGDFVFINPFDQRRWVDSHQIRKRWVVILKAAKVRYRNPYQTRHTFASHLLAGGEQELLVAKLLGHASVEMVRRHYGKYIQQPSGILLRGDYSSFGHAPSMPQEEKKSA